MLAICLTWRCISITKIYMNLNRFIRIYLLLLFALLQGVAPFAHAHVNGNNTDHDIHLAVIDSARLNGHGLNDRVLNDQDADAGQYAVEQEHSAVVYMPPVSRYDDSTPDLHINADDIKQIRPLEYSVTPCAIFSRDILPSFPYQHPCSQAPPA